MLGLVFRAEMVVNRSTQAIGVLVGVALVGALILTFLTDFWFAFGLLMFVGLAVVVAFPVVAVVFRDRAKGEAESVSTNHGDAG